MSAIGGTAPGSAILLAQGALTDSGGMFILNVSLGTKLTLSAGADGYQGSPIPLVADQNTGFIEIALDRLAEIRGRLIDDATREPIAGLTMALVRASDQAVSTSPMGSAPPSTIGADGAFSFKRVYRDDYYLRIQSKPSVRVEEIPAKALEGENREKALKVPDPAEGYGVVLWPGEDATASTSRR